MFISIIKQYYDVYMSSLTESKNIRLIPGKNVETFYMSEHKIMKVYLQRILKRNYLKAGDMETINEYILEKNYDKDIKICWSFFGINSINNRFLSKLVSNPKTHKYRLDMIDELNISMDKKFRGLARIVTTTD